MNPDLWGLSTNSKDHLVFGKYDLVDLAGRYGTPLHVVNENKLCNNYRCFGDSFAVQVPEVKCYYSYKTNCVPAVLKRLHLEGCGAEVVSTYELWLALKLGVEPSEIVYNGVIKSREDLNIAVDAGVGLINIDSVAEFKILNEIATTADHPINVGIRIYPKRGWLGQFGLNPEQDNVVEICQQLASNKHCRVTCLHAHFGSGLRSTAHYGAVTKSLCRLAVQIRDALGTPVTHINLGGGFGVPSVKMLSIPEVARYKLFNLPPHPPDINACPSFKDFAVTIGNAMRDAGGGSTEESPGLMLEPGRAITSNAQVLLVTVRDIKKRSNGRIYAITDGGMQNIAFPLSYEYHHCFVASRGTAPSSCRYYVTGPLCSPEDLLYRNWRLPELSVGDVLAIMDSGAYFTSFANNFSFPRPNIVMVSGGQSTMIRERETFEQMIAMDRFI